MNDNSIPESIDALSRQIAVSVIRYASDMALDHKERLHMTGEEYVTAIIKGLARGATNAAYEVWSVEGADQLMAALMKTLSAERTAKDNGVDPSILEGMA